MLARNVRPHSTPALFAVGLRTTSRHYHSVNLQSSAVYSDAESAILSAALARVPQYGFTPSSLTAGARDAGYPDVAATLLTRGPFELVQYHLAKQRLALACSASSLNTALDAEERIRNILILRLRANDPIIGQWQQALALMAQPSFTPAALKELSLLSDEILHLAGNVSTDSTWYAKRASLAAIYASSELFMTRDSSSGFSETERFLDRRLEEAYIIGGALEGIGKWITFSAKASIDVLRSKGFRI